MASEPITYWEATEAMEIAKDLIPKFHPHLQEFALRIVFRSKARKHLNRTALGTAEIISGRLAFFVMTEDEVEIQQAVQENPYRMFWMELSAEHWDELTEAQKVALVDHELCHFGIEFPEDADEPKMVLLAHSLEEFTDIVRRHGLWNGDLEEFAAAVMGFEGV